MQSLFFGEAFLMMELPRQHATSLSGSRLAPIDAVTASYVWKPGISVSTASLGNSGVIDTHNKFDQLEATDSGWEYQPY
jgi:hypothetical protein